MSDSRQIPHGYGADRWDERLEAEGEVATARLALAAGDVEHAAQHIAKALARDPQLPDVQEALAELAAHVDGVEQALTYFHLDDHAFVGTAAARSHLLAALGRWSEAVTLLCEVAASDPQRRPWLDTVWLQRNDMADQIAPDMMASAVCQLAVALPDPVPEEERGPLLPLLELLRACGAHHSEHAILLWCGSMVARRLGAMAEAVAWAKRSHAIEPTYFAAAMLGYALRSDGRPEEALDVWQREIAREPQPLDLYIDIVELLVSLGRAPEGLAWAERAASIDAHHPKASPSVHALRHAVHGEIRHLVALADHLRAHPDNGYAARLLAQCSDDHPWLNYIPRTGEVMTDILLDLLEQGVPHDVEGRLEVSVLEPPSARLALLSVFPQVTVAIGSVPEPDMRNPVRPVATQVWRYDGTHAHPAPAPPRPEAAEAVRRIARPSWPHLIDAFDDAVALSGHEPHDLLAVLVHPPAPREDDLGRALAEYAPDLWIRSVQTWACLGLAHHRADEPWISSERRRILTDLLNGPEDWVSEAAGLAVLATAWVDPSAREDISVLLTRRMWDAIEAWHKRQVPVVASLSRLVLATPDPDPESVDAAREILRRLEGSDDE